MGDIITGRAFTSVTTPGDLYLRLKPGLQKQETGNS